MSRAAATRKAVVAVAAALVCGAGCSGGADKSGASQAPRPTTLVMANGNGIADELVPFDDEVARLSRGALDVRFANGWRQGRPDYEVRLIRDVQAGRIKFGWAGTRAWGSVGVRSFDVLHAPFLVDSYALQARVLKSDLVGRMLADLEPLHLVGIGVLPGPMRVPALRAAAPVRPAAFAGRRVAIQRSQVAVKAIRALGATPVEIPSAGSITALDGIEQHLPSIFGNDYDLTARYVAANVHLWPRPLVLFMNAAAYKALDPSQQRILREAARNVVSRMTAADEAQDVDAVAGMCRRHTRVVNATSHDLALLRKAAAPAYADLARDPKTRGFLAAIRELRASLRARPKPLLGCRASAPTAPVARPTKLDGVYRDTITRDQLAKHDGVPPAKAIAENFGRFTLVIDRDRFAFTQENAEACTWQYGTAHLSGDKLRWSFIDGGGIAPNNAENKPGELFVWRWSLYRDRLTLRSVQPPDLGTHIWHRFASTPSARYLSRRCPPPKDALRR
jgi:TRAP-type C4-dicarboxylate transport system substrate-binding protein